MTNVLPETECGSKERKPILMTRRKTHQAGSLTFLPDEMSTFRIREYDHQNGKWIQRRYQVGIFKHKKDALKAAESIRAEVNERNNTDPKKLYARLTFKEFIETYWKEYTLRQKHQVSTLYAREKMLEKHILPVFGHKKLLDIKPADISDFLSSLSLSGKYADNTLRTTYGFLRGLFGLAEQFDLIKKNPVRPKRHSPKVRKVKKPILTLEQIATIINLLPTEVDKLLVALLSLTAIRVGEALALRWMDFNAQACQLTISHTLFRGKIKKPKTTGSIATLQLDAPLAAILSAHRRKSDFAEPHDFIFCREDGRPLCLRTCLNHLSRAIEDAGIERKKGQYGFHIFRHTAASELYKIRDLRSVQRVLRHSKISTTADIYVHPDGDVINEGLGLLADKILPNCDLAVTEESEMVN